MTTGKPALQTLWTGFGDLEEERRFRGQQQDELDRRLKYYAPLAIGFVLASAGGHVLLFPAAVWVPALCLLTVFMLLPLLLSWRIARRPDSARHAYTAMLLTSASVALGVCLTVASARYQGYPLPYEGILLVIMSIFLLSGLLARDATLVALACLAGLVAIEWSWPASEHAPLVRSFFGAALWLLGSVFSLFIERADRRDFRHREILKALAQRDPLTGLLNRRGLEERFAILAATSRRTRHPITVAVIDLDHFKAYNDTYGHEGGDAVLVAVSGVLGRYARRPLDVVARLGGEEFLIGWYDVDDAIGKSLAWQVCADIAALALPHSGAPGTGRVTASIGITTARGDASLEDLYRVADGALYTAKGAGRNCVADASPPPTPMPVAAP